MKVVLAGLLMSALPSIANAQTCSQVDGANLCVHQNMPLLIQNDTTNGQVLKNGVWEQVYQKNENNRVVSRNGTAVGFNPKAYKMGLVEHINLQIGRDVGWDQGWCGGTSASMLFKAYGAQRGLGGSYFGDPNVNSFMYKTFDLVDTKIHDGGTKLRKVKRKLKGILDRDDNESAYTGSIPSPKNYAAAGIPAYYIGIKGKTASGRKINHAIVINGVDGNDHVIYDPWGSVYRVRISGNSMKFIKGSAGSVAHDANDTVKIKDAAGFKVRRPAKAPEPVTTPKEANQAQQVARQATEQARRSSELAKQRERKRRTSELARHVARQAEQRRQAAQARQTTRQAEQPREARRNRLAELIQRVRQAAQQAQRATETRRTEQLQRAQQARNQVRQTVQPRRAEQPQVRQAQPKRPSLLERIRKRIRSWRK